MLTLSSLLDLGPGHAAHPDRRCRRSLQREDSPIDDWFDHGTIRLTLAGVLAKSSNIGTVLAADRFEAGQLHDYLTPVRPRPAHRHRRPRRDRGPAARRAAPGPTRSQDRIAFGQSLSVNGVQMAAAVNTIANGGVRVSPSLIQGSATTDDGRAGRHRPRRPSAG